MATNNQIGSPDADEAIKKVSSNFIAKEDCLKLLDHFPSQEWRAVLALVRYGGMRCPIEVMQLRWSEVD